MIGATEKASADDHPESTGDERTDPADVDLTVERNDSTDNETDAQPDAESDTDEPGSDADDETDKAS